MTNPLHYLLKAAICFGERRMQVNGGVINAVADGRKDQRFSLAMLTVQTAVKVFEEC